MSDFTNDFWNWYISVITIVSILACGIFLFKLTTRKLAPGEQPGTMGHVWDENLQEYNNPLPNWWRWLFYITLVFGLAYLALYPGLGSFKGSLGWTSTNQYDREMEVAQERFGPIFAKYASMDIPAVAADPDARKIGESLFLNYCAQCHASDARGSRGFPNLADKSWQWGGDPQAIVTTIQNGRQGIMPPMAAALPGEGVKDVAHYVMSLSGMTHDNIRSTRGAELFKTNCAVCHGTDGTGNKALGALNLTDKAWRYGQGESSIIETITTGRHGVMPAWGEFLGDDKVHILSAYVWSLSNQ
ncbi:MAG: cytochrome-c oxidase, cbb3-type subunit III [Burkholderiales bacterium]